MYTMIASKAITHLNRPIFLYLVRKIARVKVCGERTYEKDKLRRLHSIFNSRRAQISNINLKGLRRLI